MIICSYAASRYSKLSKDVIENSSNVVWNSAVGSVSCFIQNTLAGNCHGEWRLTQRYTVTKYDSGKCSENSFPTWERGGVRREGERERKSKEREAWRHSNSNNYSSPSFYTWEKLSTTRQGTVSAFSRPSSHGQIQMWRHAELYHRIDQQPNGPTQYW